MKVWWSIEDWCQGTPRPLPSAFYPLSFIYKHSGLLSPAFLYSTVLFFVSATASVSFFLLAASVFPPLRDSSFNCLHLCIPLFPLSFLTQSFHVICLLKQKWLLRLNNWSLRHLWPIQSWSGIVKCLSNNHQYHQQWLYSCVVVWVWVRQWFNNWQTIIQDNILIKYPMCLQQGNVRFSSYCYIKTIVIL